MPAALARPRVELVGAAEVEEPYQVLDEDVRDRAEAARKGLAALEAEDLRHGVADAGDDAMRP